MVAEDDPRAELLALVRAARVHVEAQRDTGAVELPAGELPSPRAQDVSSAPHEARPAPTPPIERGPAQAPRPAAAAHAGAAAGERGPRLAVLADQVRECRKCILHEARTQTVFARGNPAAELCFVGEGPGADEDAQGVPFVGKAGQLLDRMIVAMGYRPEDVYVCNVVKCRPPNNRKPEPDEMAACMPYLHEQLSLVGPKVLVALGATAAQGLLGAPVSITRLRGQWRLYRATIPVMPTFHPAYLLRNPPAKREVWADLQAVLERLGRPVPRRET